MGSINFGGITMYLGFSTCDAEGQIENGFALEVKHFNIHGFTDNGLLFDITHMDGEKERLLLESGSGYCDLMTVGKRERIMHVYIVDGYPAVMPITKASFRMRIGTCKIYDPKVGHFKEPVAAHPTEISPATFDDWKVWAAEQGIDERIIAFIALEPNRLTLGTPRGWATAGNAMKLDMQDEALYALIRGALFDKDVADKFVQFLAIRKVS